VITRIIDREKITMSGIHRAALLIGIIGISGCAHNAATNTPLTEPHNAATLASYDLARDRGSHKKTIFLLALSGGGSRAAYWSGSIMLALEKVYQDQSLNLLKEVDLISSVSGGSLPAAYYAVSYDTDDPHRPEDARSWDDGTVRFLMSRSYRGIWLKNWWRPWNIVRYWTTSYDRSDIMAETMAEAMFSRSKPPHGELTLGDLNPSRPNLVLNATNVTEGAFGKLFSFTNDGFDALCSDLNNQSVARAVMATASFPAVFSAMTFNDYRTGKDCGRKNGFYVHVFDGGNFDNLGLTSVERAIDQNLPGFGGDEARVVVMLIDSYTPTRGYNRSLADPRSFFSRFVDGNFLDSSDSLLARIRAGQIDRMKNKLEKLTRGKAVFYHVRLQDAPDEFDVHHLNKIPTDFQISTPDTTLIDKAVKQILVKENPCLKKIRDILVDGQGEMTEPYCTWKPPASADPSRDTGEPQTAGGGQTALVNDY